MDDREMESLAPAEGTSMVLTQDAALQPAQDPEQVIRIPGGNPEDPKPSKCVDCCGGPGGCNTRPKDKFWGIPAFRSYTVVSYLHNNLAYHSFVRVLVCFTPPFVFLFGFAGYPGFPVAIQNRDYLLALSNVLIVLAVSVAGTALPDEMRLILREGGCFNLLFDTSGLTNVTNKLETRMYTRDKDSPEEGTIAPEQFITKKLEESVSGCSACVIRSLYHVIAMGMVLCGVWMTALPLVVPELHVHGLFANSQYISQVLFGLWVMLVIPCGVYWCLTLSTASAMACARISMLMEPHEWNDMLEEQEHKRESFNKLTAGRGLVWTYTWVCTCCCSASEETPTSKSLSLEVSQESDKDLVLLCQDLADDTMQTLADGW